MQKSRQFFFSAGFCTRVQALYCCPRTYGIAAAASGCYREATREK